MKKSKILQDKIKSKEAKVGVLGLGYVGLPLAVAIAEKGFLTYGFDIDKEKVKKILNSNSYISDISDEELASINSKQNFITTSDFNYIDEVDIILICVPTPLDKKREPDLSYIYKAIEEIKEHKYKDKLIILESTTYPGNTENILDEYFSKEDIFLAFSPERVDPSNKMYNVKNTPKLVGGINEESTELTILFYKSILDSNVFSLSDTKTAEMCKILENTYRLVNIALIFEFAEICEKLDINIWEVIKGAKTKPYGFEAFYPGPGVGGHCIPIDPLYLTWKMKKQGIDMPLVNIANNIIENVPNKIANKINKIISDKNLTLKESKILIIGLSYKKDIGDVRESPSLKIFDKLIKEKVNVKIYDPYVKEVIINHKKYKSTNLDNLCKYDLVVICVDHSNIDYDYIYSNSKVVLDLKNTISLVNDKKKIGVVYGI